MVALKNKNQRDTIIIKWKQTTKKKKYMRSWPGSVCRQRVCFHFNWQRTAFWTQNVPLKETSVKPNPMRRTIILLFWFFLVSKFDKRRAAVHHGHMLWPQKFTLRLSLGWRMWTFLVFQRKTPNEAGFKCENKNTGDLFPNILTISCWQMQK